ncbi:MAG: ABC transporter permease [Chloroflexota bacterium]|nr:ABC transporter permease [Chloroflexota bacterium]
MTKYIIQRLFWLVLNLFFVSLITFFLLFLAPGDPALTLLKARPGQEKNYELMSSVRKHFGFDLPIHIQYLKFMGNLLNGDLGYSYFYKQPVRALLIDKFPATALLAGLAWLFAQLLGLPMGILTALRRNSLLDRGYAVFGTLLISLPSFFFALLLIFVFAFQLDWLPPGGKGWTTHLILPVVSLALPMSVGYAVLLRTTLLTLFSADFARTARAKGLAERIIVVRHVLPNALIPVVTVASIDLAYLLTGVVVIETVFSWQGLGMVASRAATQRDIPVVMGSVLFGAVLIGAGNLIADLLVARLDPRIKVGK